MTTPAQLADDLIAAMFDARPIDATLVGLRDRDDRLPDYGVAGDEDQRGRLQAILDRARELDAESLDHGDRLNRDVVIHQASGLLEHLDARAVEYTVADSFFSSTAELLIMLPRVGIADRAHADGYLARLAGLPTVLEAIAERHRSGIGAGLLPVRHLVEATVDFLDRYLAAPDDDPLRQPEPPAEADVDLAGFRAERDRLLAEVVRPAFRRYRDVLATEVVPSGRDMDHPGLSWLPGGDAIYAGLARAHTTTSRTPEELHETGLRLIEDLKREYAEIGGRVFGTDDVTEIFERLRTDPALLWSSGEEMVTEARAAIARAEKVAPAWFNRMPAESCAVEAVPESEAPGAPIAYYMSPALDGSRPGTYFVNTHRAEERARTTSEAVAFHEAVPGHHFQIALALELTDLPLLRRLAPFNAYLEGWGLYTERLAEEMGLYSGDLDRLGMLTQDAMRAGRLVVDTGLHAKGWSRQQAIDYLRTNTAMSASEIESEVDRYITAPGQALSYMVGRLEIQRIRAAAEEALGDRFDIRAFHDTVLSDGPLPLEVLDRVVREWVDSQR
ncbi:DUF885 domain-containing protein [Actinoalloteichus caeruleus]|uniref:Uncharacterized conserved protein, DUF885 familyt n=2 Tax=Actinoalloteichus cyanogriseus TaxID=2893586 RepID=A0ABT1JB71_ACTCY|nr:DUF885 domain-containing protein [Actinoalloteichus caeruleus]MCP2329757.1 Uncharacterized conserved protein, DUF885 familyt [Actinoalloteichus caeruleus DSM 43889]